MRDEPIYYVKYPVLQVRPYGLLVYERTEWMTGRRKQPKEPITTSINHSNNTDTTQAKLYTGKITDYSKRRLKRAIQLLVASAEEKEAINFKTGKTFKFRVNFITLTLPAPQGDITDKQIKKHCLDNWIKRARRKHKLNSYVWRAERQKNGNIHFHLITDTYIHYEKIRNDWNDCLQSLKFLDKFEEKNGHRNPNSTDVHAVHKVRNLTQYFIKYMTKAESEDDTIEGKVWDCSTNLKTKKNCEMLLEDDHLKTWERLADDEKVTIKHDTLFSIAFLDDKRFKKYVSGQMRTRWEEYLSIIRRNANAP
jgi:hypothetical protein